MARTETLRPSADVLSGWEIPVDAHVAAVADDSDATAIEVESTVGAVDRFALPDLPTDAVGVSTVYVRFRAFSGDGAAEVRARLFDGTNLLVGPTWTPGTSAAWFTWTPALAPDGGAWTPAKVDAVFVDAEAVALGFAALDVVAIKVDVLVSESTLSRWTPVVLELAPAGPIALDLAPLDPVVLELARASPVVLELATTDAVVLELPRAAPVVLDEP